MIKTLSNPATDLLNRACSCYPCRGIKFLLSCLREQVEKSFLNNKVFSFSLLPRHSAGTWKSFAETLLERGLAVQRFETTHLMREWLLEDAFGVDGAPEEDGRTLAREQCDKSFASSPADISAGAISIDRDSSKAKKCEVASPFLPPAAKLFQVPLRNFFFAPWNCCKFPLPCRTLSCRWRWR